MQETSEGVREPSRRGEVRGRCRVMCDANGKPLRRRRAGSARHGLATSGVRQRRFARGCVWEMLGWLLPAANYKVPMAGKPNEAGEAGQVDGLPSRLDRGIRWES